MNELIYIGDGEYESKTGTKHLKVWADAMVDMGLAVIVDSFSDCDLEPLNFEDE